MPLVPALSWTATPDTWRCSLVRGLVSAKGEAMFLSRTLSILLSYLCGSISFAYLSGRLLRGIDLRHYGSHKLSGSNVYYHIGLPAMILVGILDIGKAILPTWTAQRLGLVLATTVATGMAAMVGHNWSLFLGLQGGRGIGAAIGMLLVVFPWGVLWLLAGAILGRLVPKMAAGPAFIAIGTLPIFAGALSQPTLVVWGCVFVLLVTILKRLEANREPIPSGAERWPTLWRRLLLDRDVADFDAWIERTPKAQDA